MEIKLIVLDVDGTLTDGTICYGNSYIETKSFNVKDGMILKSLSKLDISVILLTGRKSEATTRRAEELDMEVLQNVSNKEVILEKYIVEHRINPEQILYIGDDINDYAAMRLCGFTACPADAVSEVRSFCGYVSHLQGGKGAVRDIIEMMLKKSNRWNDLIALYDIH